MANLRININSQEVANWSTAIGTLIALLALIFGAPAVVNNYQQNEFNETKVNSAITNYNLLLNELDSLYLNNIYYTVSYFPSFPSSYKPSTTSSYTAIRHFSSKKSLINAVQKDTLNRDDYKYVLSQHEYFRNINRLDFSLRKLEAVYLVLVPQNEELWKKRINNLLCLNLPFVKDNLDKCVIDASFVEYIQSLSEQDCQLCEPE